MQLVNATDKSAQVRRVGEMCTGVQWKDHCEGIATHGSAMQCLADALIRITPSKLMDADAAMHRGICCMVRALLCCVQEGASGCGRI